MRTILLWSVWAWGCVFAPATLFSATLEQWRDALNSEIYKGQVAADAPKGIIEITTPTEIYQLCHLREAADEAQELLSRAKLKKLNPTLVVVLDGPEDNWEELNKLKSLLAHQGIKMQVANSLLNAEKVFGESKNSKNKNKKNESKASTEPARPIPGISAEKPFWLNTKSNIRHNKDCRYFGKGKSGRPAKADEGKACKMCGG